MRSVDDIAMVCHEANRAYCATIGDNTQLPWEQAPDWQRESAINGVKSFIADPLAPIFQTHNNWMREKLENGWQYGEVKDEINKTHPCLVPFEKLPADQKIKDLLFHNIAFALMQEG